jgi:hypothetical protein
MLELTASGAPGGSFILQGSTNLLDWTSLYTNSAPTGAASLFDAGATNHPLRFYRALQVP